MTAVLGMTLSLKVQNNTEWTPNGTIMAGLVDGRYQTFAPTVVITAADDCCSLIDMVTMTYDRAAYGVEFSAATGLAREYIIGKYERGSAPNSNIITSQFSNVVIFISLSLLIVITAVTSVHEFIGDHRRMAISATLLSTFNRLLTIALTIFYQAALAQYVLVVNPPNDERLVVDMLTKVTSGASALYFDYDAATSRRLLEGVGDVGRAAAAAQRRGTVRYDTNYTHVLAMINNDDSVEISIDQLMMPAIAPLLNEADACLDYRLLPLGMLDSAWVAFPLDPSASKEFKEDLSSNILTRFDYALKAQERLLTNWTRTCERHFNPSTTATIGFAPLRLDVLSGAFVLLCMLLVMSVLVFVAEHCSPSAVRAQRRGALVLSRLGVEMRAAVDSASSEQDMRILLRNIRQAREDMSRARRTSSSAM